MDSAKDAYPSAAQASTTRIEDLVGALGILFQVRINKKHKNRLSMNILQRIVCWVINEAVEQIQREDKEHDLIYEIDSVPLVALARYIPLSQAKGNERCFAGNECAFSESCISENGAIMPRRPA